VTTDPFYNLHAWKTLREAVKRRDGYRCTVCGTAAIPLDVDHIQPFARRPDLALDPSNLRTICRTCHNRKRTRTRGKPKRRRNTRRW